MYGSRCLQTSKVSWYSTARCFLFTKVIPTKFDGDSHRETCIRTLNVNNTLWQILILTYAYAENVLEAYVLGALCERPIKWLTSSQASWSGPAASPQSCISKKVRIFAHYYTSKSCLLFISPAQQVLASRTVAPLPPPASWCWSRTSGSGGGRSRAGEDTRNANCKKTQRRFCFQHAYPINVISFSNCLR